MSDSQRLRFAPPCETAEATLERSIRLRGDLLRVESLQSDVARTITTTVDLPFEGGAMIFALVGAVLYRVDREAAWRVAAPQSVTFLECPTGAPIRIARGRHEAIAIYWPLGSMPVLEQWLAARDRNGEPRKPAIGTQAIHPNFTDAFEKLNKALESRDALAEQRVAAIVMELAGALVTDGNAHSLASAPTDLPELLTRLIEAVRENPALPWPLKEAADFVGYSPFHFSRIFKAQVGIGFHEFVDRTRTELAVHLLTTTDGPIDLVSSEAGFGTAQGLRESVKEYLGLVPSELRANPEDLAL